MSHAFDTEASPIVVLSPHFDDAVISCGGLLAAAHASGRRTKVVTVFAREPERGSVSLRHRIFARYDLRRAEDDRALAHLGADSERLGFLERVFRSPPLRGVGAAFRSLPRQGLAGLENLGTIRAAIADLRSREPDAMLIAPLGIGNHIDHVEVFLAALTAAIDDASLRERLWFYEDPYSIVRTARNRHFVARQLMGAPAASLAPSTWPMRVRALLLDLAQGGSPLDAMLPARARAITWHATRVSMGDHEAVKFAAIRAYSTQFAALGGEALIRALRVQHGHWGGAELLWRFEDPAVE